MREKVVTKVIKKWFFKYNFSFCLFMDGFWAPVSSWTWSVPLVEKA